MTMTTTKRKAVPGAPDEVAPLVRDHRDLPCRLDVFGARLRLAGIPFRVEASQTGFAIVIRALKGPAEFEHRLSRTWDIWWGTREVTP